MVIAVEAGAREKKKKREEEEEEERGALVERERATSKQQNHSHSLSIPFFASSTLPPPPSTPPPTMAPTPALSLAHLQRVVADLTAKLPELPFDLPALPAFVEEALEAPLARPAAAAILVVAATLLAFAVASRKGKAVRGSVYVRGAGGETVRRSSR